MFVKIMKYGNEFAYMGDDRVFLVFRQQFRLFDKHEHIFQDVYDGITVIVDVVDGPNGFSQIAGD